MIRALLFGLLCLTFLKNSMVVEAKNGQGKGPPTAFPGRGPKGYVGNGRWTTTTDPCSNPINNCPG